MWFTPNPVSTVRERLRTGATPSPWRADSDSSCVECQPPLHARDAKDDTAGKFEPTRTVKGRSVLVLILTRPGDNNCSSIVAALIQRHAKTLMK